MFNLKSVFVGAAVAALAASLTGCGGNDNNNGSSSSNRAQVRFLNALNDTNSGAGNVSLNVGNTAITTASTGVYGSFAPVNGYSSVTTGTLNATATGGGLTGSLQNTGTTTLNANQRYTLVATGQVGQTGANAPQLLAVPDFNSNNQTIPSGSVAIRVVNLTSVGNVSLFNTPSGGTATTLSSGTSNVAFGVNSSTGTYTIVPVSSVNTLDLRTAADTSTQLTLANSQLNTTTFLGGRAYTIWLLGNQAAGTQGLDVVVTQDFPVTSSSTV